MRTLAASDFCTCGHIRLEHGGKLGKGKCGVITPTVRGHSTVCFCERFKQPDFKQSQVDNLSMFVRRLLRVMQINGLSDRRVYEQATEYLTRIGQTGSILRADDIEEQ